MTITQVNTNINWLRDCPTCNATGINPVDTSKVCPKCNGEKKVGLPSYPQTPQPLPAEPFPTPRSWPEPWVKKPMYPHENPIWCDICNQQEYYI